MNEQQTSLFELLDKLDEPVLITEPYRNAAGMLLPWEDENYENN